MTGDRKRNLVISVVGHRSPVGLLLSLIYVWQGLFGSRPRWRMIEQYRHVFELIQFRAGPDKNLVRLCSRARSYLHNLADSQPRRINTILAGRQDEIANFNFIESGDVTHFHQALFAETSYRPKRSRTTKLSHNCAGGCLFIGDHHDLGRPGTQSNHATNYSRPSNHRHIKGDAGRTATVDGDGVEPYR